MTGTDCINILTAPQRKGLGCSYTYFITSSSLRVIEIYFLKKVVDGPSDWAVSTFFDIDTKKSAGQRSDFYTESLILAQNERWRRGLGMQVGRKYWM